MATPSTSSVTTSLADLPAVGDPSARTAKNTLGKDDFLKLLTTQMQHQDPLAPMDNTQFVAQLAQYSSVEQLQNVGSRLDTLLVAAATTNQLGATALVGKQILYRTDQVQLTSGAPAQLQVSLDDASDATALLVTDASGRVVRSLDLGGREAGPFTFTWDGRDGAGNLLPGGTYAVTVAATRTDGTAVKGETRVRATVTGVSFEGGAPQLLAGAATIKMSDVVELLQQST